jgi:hypothetical protein
MRGPISRRATPGNYFPAPPGARPEFDSNLSIPPGTRVIPAILPPAGRVRQTTLQTVVPEITQKGVAR